MPGLKQLLYSDLARQYELEGRHDRQPNLLRFLARLLHYRFLPNVVYGALQQVSREAEDAAPS